MRFHLVVLGLLLMPQLATAQLALKPAADLANRYIIEFAAPNDLESELRAQKSLALESLRVFQAAQVARLISDLQDTDLAILRNLWIRQAVAVSLSSRHLPAVRALAYVREVRAERQYQASPQGIITLPLSGELAQDNLGRIDIDSTWADGYRGQGVVVAIIDSGVDFLHKDLAERWRGGTNSWFDPYQLHGEPLDFTGHGTGVASIVLGGDAAGSHIGVAPNAQWIAARIFDDSGNSSESAISAVLQWIVDPDGNAATDDFPDIVQNSWGLEGTEGKCVNPFAAELAVIDALGIDQVFAVGNSGISGPGVGGFSSYLTPAFDSHVISVGALGSSDTLLFASSRGPDRCGSATIPALVAPGLVIRTADITLGGFDTDATTVNTGTSFSSPHVSGALALLRSRFKAASAAPYRAAIFASALDLGDAGDDSEYGRGLLQAGAASTVMQNQSTPLRTHEVGFSDAVYVFREAAPEAKIAVIRSGDISASATVDIHSVDGTAKSPDDYQAVMETLSFAPGESVKQVDIVIGDNSQIGDDKRFSLVLSQNVNVNLAAKLTLGVTIRDDDGAPEGEDVIGGNALGLLELLVFTGLLVGRWTRR